MPSDDPLPGVESKEELHDLIDEVCDMAVSQYRHSTEAAKLSHSDQIQNAMRLRGIQNRLRDGEITLVEAKREAADV